MIWDDDSIKLLKKLWDKGLSTTDIAKKMNVSKNAIVGKVHRLCLKARPSPIKKKDEIGEPVENNSVEVAQEQPQETKVEKTSAKKAETETKATKTKAKKAPKTEVKAEISKKYEAEAEPHKEKGAKKSAKNVKLVELDSHTCRWPIGDPRDDDFCFCGKKVHSGQTYCDEHAQIAYVKALSKK